jgi:hypothetical protein
LKIREGNQALPITNVFPVVEASPERIILQIFWIAPGIISEL